MLLLEWRDRLLTSFYIIQRGRRIHIQCNASTDNSDGSYVDQDFETAPSFDYQGLVKQDPSYPERIKFWTPELCLRQPHLFDFVITVKPRPLSFLIAARRWRHSLIHIMALSKSSPSSSFLLPRFTRFPNPLRLLRFPTYPSRIPRQRCNSPSTNEIWMYYYACRWIPRQRRYFW